MQITFADTDITQMFQVVNIKRDILPERQNFSTETPARHGAYYNGYKYQPRTVEVDILIISPTNLLPYYRSLAWMLDLEEPSELIFSDEPDKVLYAVLDGSTKIDEILKEGRGTLVFKAFDPFYYSTVEDSFTPDAGNIITINNQGTAPVHPRFEVQFNADSGYLTLVSPNGTIQIGNPKEVDGIDLPDSERLLNLNMESTSGWVVNTGVKTKTPSTTIQGTIGAKSYALYPTSYGTPISNKWTGSGLRRLLPTAVDGTKTAENWEASCTFEMEAMDGTYRLDGSQKGRFEFNIMDENNNFLAGFLMRDSVAGQEFNIPEFWVGSTLFYDEKPSIPAPKKVTQYNKTKKKYETKTVEATHVGKWNNFYGTIKIRKSGNKITFELQKVKDGKVTAKLTKTFTDTSGVLSGKKANSLNIWFGRWSTQPATGKMSATHVTFRKDNVSDFMDLPNTFGAGDKLTIDTNEGTVYLGEELYMDKVDIGSEFFEVTEGETEVKILHNSSINPTVTAYVQRKYL